MNNARLRLIRRIQTVLRIQLIFMRIRTLDPHWEKRSFFSDLLNSCFKKIIFKSYVLISRIFLSKNLNLSETKKSYNLSFSKVQIWVLRVKSFFLQFLVDILPLGSGSVDLHIFAVPDPES